MSDVPADPTIAIDLGGTNVRAALVSANGEILDRLQRGTPKTHPEPTVLLEMMREVAGDTACTRAVIGLPGIVDQDDERLESAPNLPQEWIPYLNEAWFEQRCNFAVSLANDADMAAVGESEFGAGRGDRDVIYVTISTGIGAGIVVGGQLVRGRHSGGEIGHTVIDRVAASSGAPCTVEDLGSGTAMNRKAIAAGFTQQGRDFADLVRGGTDSRAQEIFEETIWAAGLGIANLCWLVNPTVVVLGGGVGRNEDLVVPIVQRVLKEHGPTAGGETRVVVAELGDDAALAGAAAWWRAVGRSD